MTREEPGFLTFIRSQHHADRDTASRSWVVPLVSPVPVAGVSSAGPRLKQLDTAADCHRAAWAAAFSRL